MRWVAVCAAVSLGVGCGSAPPGTPDGAREGDAAVHAVDAWVPPMTDAAAPDAFLETDAGIPDAGEVEPDAGTCECSDPPECNEAVCDDGTCVEVPVADGTSCGEMGLDVCVGGACVARGCGDGYREPATSPMREGCDDGNDLDGDGCSASCEPEAVEIAGDPLGDRWMRLAPQGPSIGVDGEGRVLFIWQEDRLSPNRALAQRATPTGELVGDPIEIAPDVGNPANGDPRVAGLRDGGWVVVWRADAGATGLDVRYRLVATDGTAGPVRTAHAGGELRQLDGTVTSLGAGFVIAWSAEAPDSSLRYTLVAQRFDAGGSRIGSEIEVSTSLTDTEHGASLASVGDRWLALWVHRRLGEGSRLFFRRFEGGSALDASAVELVPSGRRPHASRLDTGEYLAVWDEGGEIWSQVLSSDATAPDPADQELVATSDDALSRGVAAPLTGRHFVAGWVEGSRSTVRLGPSPGATLPPDAAELMDHLGTWAERDVSVVPSPDGVWVAWSGYDGQSPSPAVSAFHLPLD